MVTASFRSLSIILIIPIYTCPIWKELGLLSGLDNDGLWLRVMASILFIALYDFMQLLTDNIVSAEEAPLPKSFIFIPLSCSSSSSLFLLWSALASTCGKKGDIGMMADYDQANKAHPPLSFLWAINMTTGWLCCRVSTCIIQHLSAEMTPWLAAQAECWQQHLSFNGKSDKGKCHSLLPILPPLVNQENWLLGVLKVRNLPLLYPKSGVELRVKYLKSARNCLKTKAPWRDIVDDVLMREKITC